MEQVGCRQKAAQKRGRRRGLGGRGRWARWWRQVLAVEAHMIEPAKDSVVEVKAAQVAMATLARQRARGSGHWQGPRWHEGSVPWRWWAGGTEVGRGSKDWMAITPLAGVEVTGVTGQRAVRGRNRRRPRRRKARERCKGKVQRFGAKAWWWRPEGVA